MTLLLKDFRFIFNYFVSFYYFFSSLYSSARMHTHTYPILHYLFFRLLGILGVGAEMCGGGEAIGRYVVFLYCVIEFSHLIHTKKRQKKKKNHIFVVGPTQEDQHLQDP